MPRLSQSFLPLCTIVLFGISFADAQVVKVSNVSASQRTGTKLVDVSYDLSGTATSFTVSLRISDDNGVTFTVPAKTLSGDYGTGILAGSGKKITWNAGADWNGNYNDTMRFEVTATDTPTVGDIWVTIPAGSFRMGNVFPGDGNNAELPVHTVMVDGFRIGAREVHFSTWEIVRNWATAHGYSFKYQGAGKGPNHPVQNISWHDAVKWCNARSEMENLIPCYTVNGEVYRSGEGAPDWDRSANGYRLPTEAEWEKAARGNLLDKRFPLGDTISHKAANYSAGRFFYESPQGNGFHPSYATGGFPYTSPVGSFPPNAIQIYDLAGNVTEWCWDWYDPGYYGKAEAANRPAGPATGTVRVFRGGAWNTPANSLRVSWRFASHPSAAGPAGGFRLARN